MIKDENAIIDSHYGNLLGNPKDNSVPPLGDYNLRNIGGSCFFNRGACDISKIQEKNSWRIICKNCKNRKEQD